MQLCSPFQTIWYLDVPWAITFLYGVWFRGGPHGSSGELLPQKVQKEEDKGNLVCGSYMNNDSDSNKDSDSDSSSDRASGNHDAGDDNGIKSENDTKIELSSDKMQQMVCSKKEIDNLAVMILE